MIYNLGIGDLDLDKVRLKFVLKEYTSDFCHILTTKELIIILLIHHGFKEE